MASRHCAGGASRQAMKVFGPSKPAACVNRSGWVKVANGCGASFARPARVLVTDAPACEIHWRRQSPAIAFGIHLRSPGGTPLRWEKIEHGLAVAGHRSID